MANVMLLIKKTNQILNLKKKNFKTFFKHVFVMILQNMDTA